jgi:hypothetical protein
MLKPKVQTAFLAGSDHGQDYSVLLGSADEQDRSKQWINNVSIFCQYHIRLGHH